MVSFFNGVIPEPDKLLDPVTPIHKALAPKTSFIPSRLLYDRIIARNDSACVTLSSFNCWPENISLDIDIYLKAKPASDEAVRFFPATPPATRGAIFNTRGPRIAIHFADGR